MCVLGDPLLHLNTEPERIDTELLQNVCCDKVDAHFGKALTVFLFVDRPAIHHATVAMIQVNILLRDGRMPNIHIHFVLQGATYNFLGKLLEKELHRLFRQLSADFRQIVVAERNKGHRVE